MSPVVAMLETGTANLASMRAGFARAGADVRAATGAADVREASHVLLPGVGAFAAARATLTAAGVDDALRERIERGRPTLCICVGLQLLAEASDESPGVAGLGIVPGVARRVGGVSAAAATSRTAAASPGVASAVDPRTTRIRVPQMGWNHVTAGAGCHLLPSGHVSFANSYALVDPPPGWSVATAEHGAPFIAGFERGSVVACQFHPELSGPLGAGILTRWLQELDACC